MTCLYIESTSTYVLAVPNRPAYAQKHIHKRHTVVLRLLRLARAVCDAVLLSVSFVYTVLSFLGGY